MMIVAVSTGRLTVPAKVTGLAMAALTIAISAIFVLGILPTPIIDLAGASIDTIF